MLYKIKGKEAKNIAETKLSEEEKLEQDLENWIENNPSILDEDLLIIGRQVLIPEVNDRIDLLALDTNGNVVIIELKKGRLKDPADVQSLRYASYVSRWEYDDLERQANNYYSEKGVEDFNFNERFEEFCTEAGIDEVPDLNQEQRIIILGSKLKEKLGSVALWLREHSIDIKIIEIAIFKEGETLLLNPQVIIPVATTEKFEIGKQSLKKDRPWLINGEDWHLNKRCGKETKEKLLQLHRVISSNFETAEGPQWNQKFYTAFKEGYHNWIYIVTRKTNLAFVVSIKKGDMNVKRIAKDLGIDIFDRASTLSEKFQLESSVELENRGDYDRVIIRIKEKFDVTSPEFLKFLNECYKSFKKV